MSINVVNVSPQIHPNIVCSENCSSGLDNCKSYTSSKDELFKATAKIRGLSLLERVDDLPFVWRKGELHWLLFVRELKLPSNDDSGATTVPEINKYFTVVRAARYLEWVGFTNRRKSVVR